MITIKEVLRHWPTGVPKKRIAGRLGLDPKTVRRYLGVAQTKALSFDGGIEALTDERLSNVVVALRPRRIAKPVKRGRRERQSETSSAHVAGVAGFVMSTALLGCDPPEDIDDSEAGIEGLEEADGESRSRIIASIQTEDGVTVEFLARSEQSLASW